MVATKGCSVLYNCYYFFLDFIIPAQYTTEEPQQSNFKKVTNLFLVS